AILKQIKSKEEMNEIYQPTTSNLNHWQYGIQTRVPHYQQVPKSFSKQWTDPRRPQRRTVCFYCRKKNHVVSKCPKIQIMQLECIELLDALTEEQFTEVQEMVDETMKNCSIDDPQALKYLLKILKDISLDNNLNDDKEIIYLPFYIQLAPPYKEDPIAKIIDLYLDSDIEMDNSDEVSLEDLIDEYLEALKFENSKLYHKNRSEVEKNNNEALEQNLKSVEKDSSTGISNDEHYSQYEFDIKEDKNSVLEWCSNSAEDSQLNEQSDLDSYRIVAKK
ncbi:7002_t:CDS:2, partial [Gigaspora rosea]